MSDRIDDALEGQDFSEEEELNDENIERAGCFITRLNSPDSTRLQLTGMYRDWFLDYASYVILERAVPHLDDGLKPVQRRILHSMKRLDDGRYNKVANIIGHTMQFHPHGDSSIGNALVQMGQKELLIDMQGNWGNILTGDSAAAPRYIEARLSKFALEVVYNNKTTEWMKSYDGRNLEPVTLPVKFPLLLAQGAEGIAVGLASKILPHNFNELIDASIKHLENRPFVLYPDFPTGGLADCERYNDGMRGGVVKVRAKIDKIDRRTLVIKELPFSKTTGNIIESIRRANDTGKIRVRKVEDNTAATAEIVVHLYPDSPPDKAIDALYAFTDCEISISPNSCVIHEEKPRFLPISDILRANTDRTLQLLKQELEIRLQELENQWHFSSLERIFIENRLYLTIEECETWESVISTIDEALNPWKHLLRREVVYDDIVKLTEIKIKRISKYDAKKADELIKSTEEEMEAVRKNIENIVPYTIAYYKEIKKKYGAKFPRLTELTSFESIEATRVVAATRKLYVDRENGFFGTDSKLGEYVCDCSDIDDIIVILRSGKYMIAPVQEKRFYGPDIIHLDVYNRNDKRTIYNLAYVDGVSGISYVKRCAIGALIREREYDLTQGTPSSRIHYLSVNPNGEAEVIEIRLSDRYKVKNKTFDFDFATLAIRGRGTQGNLLTKLQIKNIRCKEQGESTLAGLKLWFDPDVNRLNVEERGKFLGEFEPSDRVLAVYPNGTYETLIFDPSTRFEQDPLIVEKFDPEKVYSVAYYEGEKKYYYLKRCPLEQVDSPTSIIGESQGSKLHAISNLSDAKLKVYYRSGGRVQPEELVDAEEFIGVKSLRARGKRISTNPIRKLEFLTPPDAQEKGEGD